MAITTNKEKTVFDLEQIQRGDFIRLQKEAESEVVNGIVAVVKPTELTVFYLPKMSNVSNYIVIRVEDVDNWYSIVWSSDLTEIKGVDATDENGNP